MITGLNDEIISKLVGDAFEKSKEHTCINCSKYAGEYEKGAVYCGDIIDDNIILCLDCENKMTEEKTKKDETLNFLWEVATGDYDNDLKQKARRLYLLQSEKKKSAYLNVRMENFEERFIITDDTIEDTQSGLIWERDMSKRGEMNWIDAMKINDNGFRLPSREDFKTLANSEEYPTIEELEEIGFINAQDWYWTIDKYNSTYAYVVYFFYARLYGSGVTSSNSVLCVRRK